MARPEKRDDEDVNDIDLKLRDRQHIWLNGHYGYCKRCACSNPDRFADETLRKAITTECSREFFLMPQILLVEAGKLDYTEKKGWHDPRGGAD
jgi:hypothetical protein